MSVKSKMTAIADAVRTLRGLSGTMGLDAMATNINGASDIVTNQASLIDQIITALDNKSAGGGGGIDISDSTVTADTLLKDIIAYTAEGERVTGVVPFEWLNYIKGNGTQCIDTGFKANQDTRVVMEVEYVPTSINTFLFGCRTSSSEKTYGFSNYTNGRYRVHYNEGYDDFSADASYDGKFKIDMNKNIVTLNDGEYVYETTYATFQCDYTMWLFDLNNKDSSAGEATAKIYNCQIYDNGTLVRDFRPFRFGGLYGMCDIVNGVIYWNAGTGDFTGA